MEHASIQFDSDDSYKSDVDIKDELLSDEVQQSADETVGDEDDSSSEIEIKEECKEGVNFGMAAVMAKILNKPSEGTTIMSKSVSERLLAARKRRHLDNAEPGADVEVVKSEPSAPAESPSLTQKKLRKTKQQTLSMQQKLAREELCHTLPDPLDRTAELNLIKIATRGVVQLFNAVKQQQGKIKERVGEVKKSVRKTDKVISQFTSGDFLDRLKTQRVKTVANNSEESGECKEEVKEEPTWSALRDDFMMGAQSMKDWDKEGDGVESSEGNPDEDLESDGD